KIVVATEPEEIPRLHTLFERGNQNGLTGLKMLGADAIREREPKARGLEAVLVPEEGIVDYPAVMRNMESKIAGAGGTIHLASGVRKMTRVDKVWEIETASGHFSADFVVGCAGLQADRVSRMTGENPEAKIVPFRGEYFKLKKDREHLVRHLIYPVPDPRIPFLGVHFTRLAVGGVEAGPNAVLAFAREGYKKSDVNLCDLGESLSFPGLWRFIKKYPGTTFDELRRSFFKSVFCRSLQRLVPEVQLADLEPGGAGVRAQLMSREGELVQDFYLLDGPGSLHVLNAPSPAATASLAIGEEIAERVSQNLLRI
ncbi:MAG: L-2-hydroxyglutarate oxidase, partial [Spirochaetia bacterium]|nr:L-2-hydroxyglutarate oxidase [Spirochaetia bacterium]